MPKPAVLTVKKLVSLEPEMVKAIEDFRFAQRIKSESEAIRALISAGLQSQSLPRSAALRLMGPGTTEGGTKPKARRTK
jgi:Arc/MetJ-type ribon-helix-helix transcriptional regulator